MHIWQQWQPKAQGSLDAGKIWPTAEELHALDQAYPDEVIPEREVRVGQIVQPQQNWSQPRESDGLSCGKWPV